MSVIVRCNKCGKERATYNDPRKNPDATIIECKATCFESHVKWTYVRDDAAAAPAAPAAAPVAAVAASSPAANADRRADDAPPKPRQAFAEGSPDKSRDAEKKKKEDASCPCTAM